jgi:hypothetical protein
MGWLDSFKKRHNIVWNRVCGESKDVDESIVSKYKLKLLEFISPYEPKNMYNVDNTGLFFGHYQQNHSRLWEKSVPGGGNVQRKTMLLCGNMVGEMEKPLEIVKAAKPRCFKILKIDNFPVI